jgi:hypothetical protein
MVIGGDVVGTIKIKWDVLKTLKKGISHISTRSEITMKQKQ